MTPRKIWNHFSRNNAIHHYEQLMKIDKAEGRIDSESAFSPIYAYKVLHDWVLKQHVPYLPTNEEEELLNAYEEPTEEEWLKLYGDTSYVDSGPKPVQVINGVKFPIKEGHKIVRKLKENPNGFHYSFVDGSLHNYKNPAKLTPKGTQVWYNKGLKHREDGPAYIRYDKSQIWYKRGVKHRENGPAFIKGPIQIWYKKGLKHREDGPAYIKLDGSKEWYFNNLLHNTKGPAIIKPDGSRLWALNGHIYKDFREYGIDVFKHQEQTQ